MAYHFIYTDGATPKQNAQSSYENLKKAGLDPTQTWIAADLEYDTWTKNGEKCTKEKCTQYTKEYLDALKALGCNKLFIYTNQDYYKNYYDWSQLKYPIWLADYNGDPNYDCAMQQYSPYGKVNGIGGNVDMDWLFDESMMDGVQTTTTSTPAPTKTTEQIAKEVINGKWGNGDERKKKLEAAGYNYSTVQNKVNELLGGGSKTTTPAPAPTNTHANTNVKTDYAQSFSKSIARTYTTTASLRLRTGASTSKAIITVIPKGAKVNCYGYYTGGWYYVQYGNHTGFCSKDWLR